MADYNSFNKIPYDSQPIHRQTDYKGSAPRNEGGNRVRGSLRGGVALVVCILLIINIILGSLLISALKGKNNALHQTEVTINSSGLDAAAVTAKASPSVVLVHAGVPDKVEVNSEATFFQMRTKGAGVIFKDDKEQGGAYILTCYHVVRDYPGQIYVTLFDNTTPIAATLLKQYSYSQVYDIAVLKIEASDIYRASAAKPCEVADSSYISAGEGVVVIGNPLGKGFSISTGVISRTNAFITTSNITKRGIRIDAAVNEGNSGGGLFNGAGQLIGIVNAKEAASVEDMAYAVHSNVALNLAKNMLENDRPMKAILGMTLESKGSTQTIIDEKLYAVEDVYISSVELGTAAAKAGLVGDKSEKVLGFTIGDKYYAMMTKYTLEDYSFLLTRGTRLTLKLLVDGQEREVEIEVERMVSVDSSQWY